MITFSGSDIAPVGEEVCLTVSGVGAGFSSVVTSGKKEIRHTVKIDPHNKTATICFTIPPGSPGVTVWAKNALDARKSSFTVLAAL